MLVGFHATYTTSAMFLTGMAANPLIAEFARKVAHVELTWIQWAVAASVPGLLSLALIPYLIYRLHPPEIRDTQAAQQHAMQELHRMGPLSSREWRLLAILLAVMAGWVTSPWHGLHNAFVALAGVSAILLARVLTWDDLLHETKAWDALIWFAGLLMMADALLDSGVVKIISSAVFARTAGWPVLAVHSAARRAVPGRPRAGRMYRATPLAVTERYVEAFCHAQVPGSMMTLRPMRCAAAANASGASRSGNRCVTSCVRSTRCSAARLIALG